MTDIALASSPVSSRRRKKLRTLPLKRARLFNRRYREEHPELSDDEHHWRPRTRGDCVNVPRPCPYVSCKYNLFLDVTENGSIKINQGNIYDMDPTRMHPGFSCALDVADQVSRRGKIRARDIATAINVSTERIRQIVRQAVEHLVDLEAKVNKLVG